VTRTELPKPAPQLHAPLVQRSKHPSTAAVTVPSAAATTQRLPASIAAKPPMPMSVPRCPS
jgi:hypothetical protein